MIHANVYQRLQLLLNDLEQNVPGRPYFLSFLSDIKETDFIYAISTEATRIWTRIFRQW